MKSNTITKNKADNASYKAFTKSLSSGNVGSFYIFHGQERYLLEGSLKGLRAKLCPDGLDSFNYKRFDGKTLSAEELEDAIDTLPAFADRTLIEIHDYDIFKSAQKERLCVVFSDLPDYVCVIFIYGAIEYKPDGRKKTDKEILKYANVIKFNAQDQDRLVDWILRHFHDAGKKISKSNAEYIASLTGGLMTRLNGEIEKAAAYAKAEFVTRKDIDAVVTPVLDAVAFRLADAIVSGDNAGALRLLAELLQMREQPHKLLYLISLRMRQLLAARVFIDSNRGSSELMQICDIRFDFIARNLMGTAKSTTLAYCRQAVLHCSEVALELNSTAEPESRLIELVTKLANI